MASRLGFTVMASRPAHQQDGISEDKVSLEYWGDNRDESDASEGVSCQ